MKQATQAAPTDKTVRRPRCKQCSKQFRTTIATKIYCSAQCKTIATNAKRKVDYTARASNSAFMYYLASEAERAGTLEILRGHTAQSLVELYRVYAYTLRVNDYGDNNAYAISHIAPVRGNGTLGLLHACNLVVTLAPMNLSHATQYFGFGASIPRYDLLHKHAVLKGASRKDTISRIIAYLGADVVSEAVKLGKIQPTRRHTLLLWLRDHLDSKDPRLSKLDTLSSKALATLKASVQGKAESEGFKLMIKEVHCVEVFASELKRHCEYRPELSELATFLSSCLRRINKREQFLVESPLLQLMFNVLHGQDLTKVMPDLHAVLVTLASLAKLSIPASLDMVVPLEDIPSSLQIAPVVLLQTFTSVFDDIDQPAPYTVPTLVSGGYVEPDSPFD